MFELPQERLELAPMAFLKAPASFLPNFPMAKTTQQAQKRGYISKNKSNNPRAWLGGLEHRIFLQSFLALKLCEKIFCKWGSKESERE
jgi:hypothetical protein